MATRPSGAGQGSCECGQGRHREGDIDELTSSYDQDIRNGAPMGRRVQGISLKSVHVLKRV